MLGPSSRSDSLYQLSHPGPRKPRYPLKRTLSGLQSRFEHFREGKSRLLLPASEPLFLRSPACKLNTVENWPKKKWKVKVNETKSLHVTFNLRKNNCPALSINQTVLTQVESVKYLGLQFDCKLNWKEHIAKKRKRTDLKAKEINWLIGRNSNLSL